MKHVSYKMIYMLLLAVCCLTARAAVKPAVATGALPAVWQAAGPQEKLKALRVAELDALRLLTERIYGFQLNSGTTVYDLMLADDELRMGIARTIKGVTTTESPEYLDDGIVQISRAVELRQVLETVTQTVVKKNALFGRMVTMSDVEKAEQECRNVVFDVMGNGALPGSPGMRKIRAKRAAEIDAYRKLAERLMGVQVTSSTTMKDFVLRSDKIRACTAQLIKGARPVSIKYLADDSCEVSMQIKVADIFRIIRKYSQDDMENMAVERDYATTTFTETGHGAPRLAGDEIVAAAMPVSEMEALNDAYRETGIIIRQLVGRDVVFE
ncbi:MAG: hypothetical protein WC299_05650 [Kiritimatiellia bacterium]